MIIERGSNQKDPSNREMIALLGKAPQTMNNEMKRGQVDLSFQGGGRIPYSADKAEQDERHKRLTLGCTATRSPQNSKKEAILDNPSLEVISLAKDMPCASTVYTWIHKGWIDGIT